MADRLRFHPLVVSDLSDAIEWYSGISGELANRFRRLVDERFDDISENAQSFAFAFDEVRFARLRRFPYILLFRELRDVVYLLGVFHGASDPQKWQERAADAYGPNEPDD